MGINIIVFAGIGEENGGSSFSSSNLKVPCNSCSALGYVAKNDCAVNSKISCVILEGIGPLEAAGRGGSGEAPRGFLVDDRSDSALSSEGGRFWPPWSDDPRRVAGVISADKGNRRWSCADTAMGVAEEVASATTEVVSLRLNDG